MAIVSIGMPVRNGEAYVAEALESLLSQDLDDFQLIISDNASEDSTPRICRHFAAIDSRVTYKRCSQDVGPAANFNRVLSLAEARYFMWAAHDDLWQPTYISSCVDRLERDPQAVSCCTGIELIGSAGEHLAWVLDDGGIASSKWTTRVAGIVARRDGFLGFGFYGLHRKEILEQVVPLDDQFGADVLLTLRLAKLGTTCWVPRPLFRYRIRTKAAPAASIIPNPQTELRPVSRLRATVIKELKKDHPAHRKMVLIMWRLWRSTFPGGSWNKFLVAENAALIRSSVTRRDYLAAAGYTFRHMLLNPLSPLKLENWNRAAKAAGAFWRSRQN